jgi:nucleoside-diphosphate-sugar epimerase
MRLLVLGGSVFLSRAVAGEAVRRGHDVTCGCRGSSALPDGVKHVVLDRATDDPAEKLTGEYDAVVDVARHPSWVRRAVAALPDAHYVFVSTISVYADTTVPLGSPETLPLVEAVDEDVDLAEDPEAYGGMKVACERAVLDHGPAMVVRPGLIVGPGDPTGRFTYWPVRLADGGPILAPGRPDDPVQVIDARDLASWLVDCAEQRRTGVVDGVGPVLTWAGLLAEVARGVGVTAELVWADSSRLLELGVTPWSGRGSLPVWLPPEEYAGMLTHDPAPATAAGLRTRPLSETARDTLAWVRAAEGAQVGGVTREEEAELLRQLAE